jgi:hypothetical protein
MKILIISFCLFFSSLIFCQKDSLSEVYYNKIIVYSDLGYYSCPFDIKVDKLATLEYRNNIKPFIGVGLNYKWGSIRIGSLLNYHLKGLDNFGVTKILKIGTEFFYKRFLFDLSYYKLNGYTLIGGSLIDLRNNIIFSDLNFTSMSLNTWFYLDKNFSHYALKGIKQSVKKSNWTVYLKNTNAYLIISNIESIIPKVINDKLSGKSINFNKISAIEVGLLSGIAYALKIKSNYQLGGMIGYGGVLIDRSINGINLSKNLLGLSSRYDFHLFAGYNVKKYFFMNYLDLDYRKIEFSNYEINSRVISFRFVAGYRF